MNASDWFVLFCLGDFESGDEIGRQNLITRMDIHNLQRVYGLRKAEKHTHDMLSVAAWIKEHESQSESEQSSPFFCYQPLTSDDSDFVLGKDILSLRVDKLQ